MSLLAPLPAPTLPATYSRPPAPEARPGCVPNPAGKAGERCAVCGAVAMVRHETQQLPCGHYAFRTRSGVVVGWINTVDMVLNLDRMVDHMSTVAPKVNSRTALPVE